MVRILAATDQALEGHEPNFAVQSGVRTDAVTIPNGKVHIPSPNRHGSTSPVAP